MGNHNVTSGLAPANKKYNATLASRPARKQITTRHWPAGPASCLVNYFLHNSVSCTNTVLPKITTRPRMKNYNAASGLAQAKKIQRDNGQLAKAKKITTRHWLPTGWLSCHVVIYFSAKNHNVVKFGQEPDALLCDPANPRRRPPFRY